MPTCKICNEEKTNNKGLSYHISLKHKMKFEQYTLEFELNGVEPLCGCGCGEKTRFLNGRFMEYRNGHFWVDREKSKDHIDKIVKKQTGRKLSQEWKDNIGDGMKLAIANGATNIQKMNDAVRGTKWTEDHRQKVSTTRSARLASGDIIINRDKISETVTQKYLNGGFKWSRGKHISHKLIGKPFAYYRSKWELRHMLEMDADPHIKSYQYEPFSISYEWEGKNHRYIPDFLVKYENNETQLQEVGVKELKNLPRNLAKIEAARFYASNMNWSFKVISFDSI